MKSVKLGALTLAAVAIALTGCGSAKPAPPAQSASAACKSFNAWLELNSATGNLVAGQGPKLLAKAVKEAPSGSLYKDMSLLQQNLATTLAAKGSPLYTGEKLFALEDIQQVQSDCSSVNPGG